MWLLPEKSRMPGVASGFLAFVTGLSIGLTPPPAMDVNAWAETERYVAAESGSPQPGKWNTALVPYVREPQECLSSAHPSRDVVVMKSAQTAFTEVGVNAVGAYVDRDPCPILIVLPTTDEAKKYNNIKLQPTIDVTPALKRRIRDLKSRDEESSTTLFKRFDRGFIVTTGANSSSGLQMISARVIIFDEVSSYPAEAGGRGDPVEQALSRSKAWLPYQPKRYFCSTPDLAGVCRIEARFAISDQRRYYVPCPVCGTFQVLEFANLDWDSDERPHKAYFRCVSGNGCVIEPHHKRQMLAKGVWLKTYEGAADNPRPPEAIAPADIDRWRARPSGTREPGFAIWQAYSPFVSWDDTVNEYLLAKDNPTKLKAFTQQALGLPWEERGEAPPAEKLLGARESFQRRRVPEGALLITAMVDVQADRLEYGTYAWSERLTHGWHIDGGVINGDPATDAPWFELDKVLARTYEDSRGHAWDIDAFGVDSGFLSNRVYAWTHKHALPRQPREAHLPDSTRHVFALDGRAGWKLPAIGTPSTRDIDFEGKKVGAVRLWPVGTFDMKSEIYAGLRNLLEGRDEIGQWRGSPVLHFAIEMVDLNFLEQITAEHVATVEKRGGHATKEWVNPARKRNEQLDIAVGARALAHHLADGLTQEEWNALAARRAMPRIEQQGDLASLWAPGLASPLQQAQEVPPQPPAQPSAPTREADAGDWLGGRAENYWG